jgi:hypothetical protein
MREFIDDIIFFLLIISFLFFGLVMPHIFDEMTNQKLIEQAIIENSFNETEIELLKSFEASSDTSVEEATKQVKAIRKYTESKNK